jgi:hypothetical protein
MSASFSMALPPRALQTVPAGSSSAAGRANQASEPSFSNICATCSAPRPTTAARRSLAVKDGDGHAPGPLARDAPVRPVQDHVVDPVAAPVRDPAHAVNGGQGLSAKVGGLHGDEPLPGGAEDDGLLAAPAVGVGVREGAAFNSAPLAARALLTSSLASNTNLPAKSSTSLVKQPSLSTGAYTSRP